MAQYRIATPQGSAVVEAPEGATKAEVINLYNKAMTSYSTETSRGVREDTRRYMDAQLSQAQQIARSREPGIFDYIQEVPKGLIGGAANLVEQGAVGLAALLPEGAEDVVRGGIKAVGGAVQDYVEPDFNLESSVPRKLSEAVGSFVGLAGVSLFNPLAGAGLAVSAGAGEASERARAAGTSEEDRSTAALWGIIPGALELLPIGFLKALGRDGVRSILNTTARVLSSGGVEAAQEATTGLIQNLIAQGIYKPDQKLIEGVGEQAAYGGAVGAIVQGLIELATPRTRGGASAATPAAEQETLALPAPEGIAGLITDRRPQEARETIAASLDETGEVPLAAMQDIQSRTNLPLGTLESIAQEEMDKRGSTLAQRAQTDMEAELDAATAPETTAPVSRLSAAVEDSKQGVGAVEGRVTRDAQAAQVAAREREALRAADRGDTAAFEQPDLFARELETARRDPRGRSLQNITSPEQAVETQAPSDQLDPDAAQGDLVDLINQDKAREDNANVRKATEQARKKEEDIAVDTELGLRDMQEKVSEPARRAQDRERPEQLSMRGQLFQPKSPMITADMLPQPLKGRPDAASGIERATPIAGGRGASAEGAIQGGAAASSDGASAGQDTQKTPTPDAGRVGPPVSSTADAPAGTVAQPSALINRVKAKLEEAATTGLKGTAATAPIQARNIIENMKADGQKIGREKAVLIVKDLQKQGFLETPNFRGEAKLSPTRNDAPAGAVAQPSALDTPIAPPQLNIDNPAGTWLEGKIERAQEDKADAEPDTYKANLGNSAGVTGWFEKPLNLDPKMLAKFKGAMGEEKIRTFSPKLKRLQKDIAKEGYKPEAILIHVREDGTPFIVDGNHRVAEAAASGRQSIPVEIKYLRGAEAVDGPLNPSILSGKAAADGTPTTKQVTQKATPTPGAAEATSPSVKQTTQKAKPTSGTAKSKPEGKPVATKTNADRVVEAVAEYRKIKSPTGNQAAAFVSRLTDLGIANPPAFLANLQKMKEQLKLPADLTLEFPVDTSVSAAVESGDLKGALEALATTAPDAKVQRIAKKLASNVGNTQLVTKKNLKADDGSAVAGYFDPETNTIFLDAETGISTHPILHEVLHAVTSATVANKSHPLTKRLTKIFEGVQEQLAGEYGLTSLDEFVAEAMSNPEFQTQLKTTTVNGRNPWQQLVRAVSNYVRRMLGLETKPEGSTLDAVDEIVQAMIAPTFDGRIATKMYMQIKTPAGAAKVINDLAAKTINATKGKDFYDYVQEGRSFLGGNIPPLAKKLWLNLQPVNILGELAESRIPGARQLNTIINNMSAALRKRNESLDPIVGDLKAFRRKSPDKFKTLQALVPNASAERIDPREADFDKAYGRDKSDKEQVKIAREIHKEFRKQYDSLGKEGQDLYKVITNTFEAALNDVMKSVDANLEANGVDAGMRKKALDKIAKLLDMERGVIKPFSPLTRAGTHRLKFATIDPKTDKIEVFVERYKTRGQREEAKKQLKEYNDKWLAKLPANDPRIAGIKEEWEEGTSSSVINFDNAPKGSFVYDTLRILEAEGVDKDTQHRIVDLALDSMPERSFMQSMRQRKDVRGFKGDITPTAGAGDKRFFGLLDDSFDLVDMVQTKGRDYNRQLVQMEYGAKLQKFKNEILNTIDSNKSDEITMLYRDRMELIANFAQRPNIPRWSQSLNAGGYLMTMGWNLSSAAITTFDVFMSTAPRLMGKYGDGATAKALGSAAVILRRSPKFKMVSVMGPDGKMTDRKVNTGLAGFSIGNYDFTDANLPSEVKDLEVLVGVASENAQINQSLNQEELDMNNAKDLLEKVNSWTSFLFHHAERYNREVAMTATYMLELGRMKAAKGSALTAAEKKAAAELAVRETEFTLGATASAGRPVVSQNAIGNVAMLFKRFAISKYHMMATMTNDAFQAGGDAQTKENRRIAQHQLGRFLVSTGLFAGVAGMPLMGALGQIYDFFVDDDEDDFDAMLRKTIGEGLYGGIINTVLGVEVASRISLNSLLYRPPIIDKDQAGCGPFWNNLVAP
jgi:hypothetical protein